MCSSVELSLSGHATSILENRMTQKNKNAARLAMSLKDLKPGELVLIKHNPFHGPAATDILATVKKWRPGEGFMECDLAEVAYTHPETGKRHTLPFGTGNLKLAKLDELDAIATRHETEAARMRELINTLRGEA